jgi:hypothetical protein
MTPAGGVEPTLRIVPTYNRDALMTSAQIVPLKAAA